MQVIYILNYSVGELDIKVTDEEIENYDDYLSSLGYNLDDILFMVSDRLNIKAI